MGTIPTDKKVNVIHIHLSPSDEWIAEKLSEKEAEGRVGRSNSDSELSKLMKDEDLRAEGLSPKPIIFTEEGAAPQDWISLLPKKHRKPTPFDKYINNEELTSPAVISTKFDESLAVKAYMMFKRAIDEAGESEVVVIAITGKDGSGKSTLESNLSEMFEKDYGRSPRAISYTTRKERPAEKELRERAGKRAYFFVEDEKDIIDNPDVLEYERYGDNLYGSSKSQLFSGHSVIVLEQNGAISLRRAANEHNRKLSTKIDSTLGTSADTKLKESPFLGQGVKI